MSKTSAIRCGLIFCLLVLGGARTASAESLLVIPFEQNSGAADLHWVGESFAESLNLRLAVGGHAPLSREERLALFEQFGLPANAPVTHASLLRLGEEADADGVVWGWYEVQKGRIRAQARVLELAGPHLSAVLAEEGPLGELLDVQDRLAWRILWQLDPKFPLSREEFRQRVLRWRPSAFESYVRGLLAMNREQQRRYFLQATRLDPSYGAPAFRLGQYYFEERDFATAARWYAKVPMRDPVVLEAQFYLALCQFEANDYDRAAETLRAIAARRPSRAVWNNLGVFYSRQKDERAPAAFQRALDQAPGDPDVFFNLGLYHMRMEDWTAAEEAFRRGVELNPADTEAHFLRAQALGHLGRSQEAQAARLLAVGDNPALALSLERRELELDRLSSEYNARWLPALARETDSVSPRSRHAAVHVQRGEHFLARSALPKARREFTQAILLDPDAYRAHLLLASVYEREGRSEEAVAELRAALWSRESADTHTRLAELLLTLGRPEEARRHVRAALALEQNHAAARVLEAQLPAEVAETPGEEMDMQ